LGDLLKLRLDNIVKDGTRYRLDIVEEKTKKTRTFTVSTDVYSYLKVYAFDHNIKPSAKLFNLTERAVQKYLKMVVNHLELTHISTHSFRKMFATQAYEESGYNIELVRTLLQHSSTATTQRYIGIGSEQIETFLGSRSKLLRT
jgi:integrase